MSALMLGGVLSGSAAVATSAKGPWTAPLLIDPAANSGEGPNEIACPSSDFCIVSDDLGNVITSTDPFAASPTWTSTKLALSLNSVACASASFCVAAGGFEVFVSTDPAGGASQWHSVDVPNPGWAGSISCPSAGFCAVSGTAGNSSYVAASANLTSQTPTWSVSHADQSSGIAGISCTSTAFCVAADDSGNVLVSTNSTAATPTWSTTAVGNGGGGFQGISCGSPTLCVAVGEAANKDLFTTTNPTASTARWKGLEVTADGGASAGGGSELHAVSCTSSGTCGAVDIYGRAYVSTAPAATSPFWPAAFVTRQSVGDLTAVSCTPQGQCAAVDSNGHVYTAEHPTAVPGPKVAARVSPSAVTRGAAVTVKVSVKSPAGWVAGKVEVSHGTKALCRTTYNVRAIVNSASCKVASTKLARGRNKIKVAYLGNDDYAPAATTVSVTVRS